jgi:hypothetical protein
MKTTPDRFEQLVYHVEAVDLFHVVDYERRAKLDDYVVVDRIDGDGLAIERYCGQDYYGVVRWLEFYALEHSTQHTPARTCPN